MRKTKGYTLVDVLFAMAFMVTVVSMATMAYSHMLKQSLDLTKNKGHIVKIGKMTLQLKMDLWRSDSVTVELNGFSTYRDSIEVNYLMEDILTRHQNDKIDTIDLTLLNIDSEDGILTMEYEQLGEPFMLVVETNSDLADKINQNMTDLGTRPF